MTPKAAYPAPPRRAYELAKRLIDVGVSSLALVALSPVLLGALLAVRLIEGRPALFRQPRLGYRERPFCLYKLRTMSERRNPDGSLLPDEQRSTRLGRLLRAISLDELPQLWNVLKGEMSLVGPRPLLARYLDRYSSHQRRRHEVKPGITGWAQINGRNALTWEEKFELDVWYVDHRNLWLDLRILAATARQVLRRDGISQPGHATMQEFMGDRQGAGAENYRRS
ncbi:MAG: sugar transferase [Bryobacteraceae bacterium]